MGRYYHKKHRAVYFELGLNKSGRLRADVFALAMNGYMVIVEVKSSVADFRADKKMESYFDFANQMYLATPEKVYAKIKGDLLEGLGVFIMSDDGRSILKVKAAKRYEIDDETILNMAIRCAFRDSDTSTRKNKNAKAQLTA